MALRERPDEDRLEAVAEKRDHPLKPHPRLGHGTCGGPLEQRDEDAAFGARAQARHGLRQREFAREPNGHVAEEKVEDPGKHGLDARRLSTGEAGHDRRDRLHASVAHDVVGDPVALAA